MAARRALPDIVTVLQSRKGKGNALAAGFARVTGDIVVMFDADGSADPAEIARFVEALKDGADFAKGSRFTAGGGSADITPIRRLGNLFLNGVFNLGLPDPLLRPLLRLQRVLGRPDPAARPARPQRPGAGQRQDAVGRRVRDRDRHQLPLRRRQVSITEVPSVEKLRMFGESNLRAVQDGLRVLRTLITEWRRARAMRRMERKLAQPAVAKPAPVSTRIAA